MSLYTARRHYCCKGTESTTCYDYETENCCGGSKTGNKCPKPKTCCLKPDGTANCCDPLACEDCNSATGECESRCPDCQTCDGAGNCRDCDPAKCETCIDGECVVCGGDKCKTCDGAGNCITKCDPDQCEDCNYTTGACQSQCESDHPCDGNGHCVYISFTSPTTDEKIYFDLSSSGVLTININVDVTSGDVDVGDISVDCDGIGISSKTIGPVTMDASGNYIVTITFTGLPASNWDFGPKTVKVYYKGTLVNSVGIKVFFLKYMTNHPGAGSGTTPNWYYYWNYAGVDTGTHQYDGTLACDGSYTCGDSYFKIGSYAAGTDGGLVVKKDGIDNFGSTCLHEKAHMDYFLNTWGTWANYLSRRATEDIDGDGLKDSQEPSLIGLDGQPYNPSKKDTNEDDYDDGEDWACKYEAIWGDGSCDYVDWSYPGHQSN